MLRDIRLERREKVPKYTLEECGEVIGVSPAMYYQYERDPQKLSRENARKLAKHLKCKLSDIYGEE